MNLKQILVGLDGSPREPSVLAAAVELAQRFDARLILCRVIGLPPEIPAEAWQVPGQSLEAYLQQHAKEAMQRAAESLPAPVRQRVQFETVTATAWQGLCVTAQAHDAGLIVIGSHGYGGLDRVLGTTAARVVNHALCSVLVVRAPGSPAPA